MNETTIRRACKKLMQQADLVYVSTVDEAGYPSTRAMGNLYNLEQYNRLAGFLENQPNDFTVYLNTNRESLKMDQIGKNPKVCLYYSSYSEIHGLALTGQIEIIEDPGIRKTIWQDDWIQFYAGGLNGSDYTVLRVISTFASGWYKTAKFEFKIA